MAYRILVPQLGIKLMLPEVGMHNFKTLDSQRNTIKKIFFFFNLKLNSHRG